MKYGAWGKTQFAVAKATVTRGKKQSVRKKDLAKLRKLFPTILPTQIEKIYNETGEDIENSIFNLSALQSQPEPSPENIDFLEDMFDDVDKTYIEQVFGECDNDISQATAFLIESLDEDLQTSDDAFGSSNIGYVNKEALKKRMDKSMTDIIFELFPTLEKTVVLEAYQKSDFDLVKTIGALNAQFYDGEISETSEKTESPKTRYEENYPALAGTPKTKVVRKGYWAKDQNNHFLDGNDVESVKKIEILKKSFPAIDDVTVKEIFFQMGDSLEESIAKLREMFPSNYREVPMQGTIYIPYPTQISRESSTESESRVESGTAISDSLFNEYLQLMQRSRELHDVYFQAASNMVSSRNFNDAKKLTSEGKKHHSIFKEIYGKIYKEIYRRNNEKLAQDQIDLHGLLVEEALAFLEVFLKKSRGVVRKTEVITGKGIHSIRGISRLKPAVAKMLGEKNYKFSEIEGGFMVSLT